MGHRIYEVPISYAGREFNEGKKISLERRLRRDGDADPLPDHTIATPPRRRARRPARPHCVPSEPGRLVAAAAVMAILVFYPELALPSRVLADYDVWTYFYPLRSYAADAVPGPVAFRCGTQTPSSVRRSSRTPDRLSVSGHLAVLRVAGPVRLLAIRHPARRSVLGPDRAVSSRTFGVARVAAFVGACAFAFGGFVSSQVGHVNQLSATALMPGIALAVVAAVRERSLNWALGGAALSRPSYLRAMPRKAT